MSETRSIKLAIVQVRKVFDDAYAGLIEAGEMDVIARKEAADAALAALPFLDCSVAVQEYIRCISWMHKRSMVEKSEVNAHMYTAQQAIAAFDSGTKYTPKRKAVTIASSKKQPTRVR